MDDNRSLRSYFAGRMGRFFVESNIKQKNNNQKQSVSNSNFNIKISQINHNDFSSNLTATINDTIPNEILTVKSSNFFGVSSIKKLGKTMIEANQVADK